MIFEQIPINPSSTRNFSYLVGCEDTSKAILFDPAFEPDTFLSTLEEQGLDLSLILNTHGHQDHINANEPVREETGARIGNHPADRVRSDMDIEHGDEVEVGQLDVQVYHTPGHSQGSCSFLIDETKLISGDTLFVGKVGGTSNSGKDARQQYESIHNVLMQLPEEVEVYPGHDYGPMPHSTIGWEKEHNPFVRQTSFEAFCQLKTNWQQEKRKWESYWEDLKK